MAYKPITEEQWLSWLGATIVDHYKTEKVGPEDVLWIYTRDNQLNVYFVPGRGGAGDPAQDAQARDGGLGTCPKDARQDIWRLESDPSRPAVFGFPAKAWCLYRGLPPSATIPKKGENDKPDLVIPIDF
jgi:hypothetical protein